MAKMMKWPKEKCQTLLRDPKSSILKKEEFVNNRIHQLLTTLVNRYYAWRWGVELGGNTSFFGLMKFHREPLSKIIIGNGCTFRSYYFSNLIGINHPCIISTHSELAEIRIGNNCGFSGTVIGAKQSIVFGDHVICGANSVISDFDWHSLDPYDRGNPKKIKTAPILICNNVWLGMNTIVLKGVTIGENSVIGANSVVTKSIPANVIAGGNPAKVIGNI
jgi:acetyltransferase-like isoleucine patch superfamily enzyme